ncbi:MAG: hypothetical protein N2B06_14125 [Clostridium sp.]
MKSKKIAYLIILLAILIIGSLVITTIYSKNLAVTESSGKKEVNNGKKSINEDQLTDGLSRFNEEGSVQVNAVLEKASENKQQYITIKVELNTHSVDLDAFEFSKNVSFKTSEGIKLDKEILWKKTDGGGHHYSGIYKVPKQVNGKPIIDAKTKFIELNIQKLDDVANRSFRWNKNVLEL